jgi:integrase
MGKPNLKLVSPASVNRAVGLRRPTNKKMGRPREYLTKSEITQLIKSTKNNRHAARDGTMILIGYLHGLRVSELTGLQWSDVSFEDATLHIRRAKGGVTGSHPLRGDEKRALRAMQRQAKGTWVFETERGGPFTTAGFASLIGRAGKDANIDFKVHPHMLRHSAGYAAINADVGVRDLQDFLGHRSINSTTRYAALASGRFKSIVEKM